MQPVILEVAFAITETTPQGTTFGNIDGPCEGGHIAKRDFWSGVGACFLRILACAYFAYPEITTDACVVRDLQADVTDATGAFVFSGVTFMEAINVCQWKCRNERHRVGT